MRKLIIVICLFAFCFGFSQSKLSPGTSPNEAFRSVRDGYKTALGWELKKGDTIQLGIGSRDRQSFTYVYSSPNSFSQMFDTNGTESISYLSSDYNKKVAVIKKFGTIGNKKTGYHAYAVVGIGQMENYWIDIENAIEFGELVPADPKYIPKTDPIEVKIIGSAPDKYDQLKKLKELLDNGTITLEEYEIEKKKILNN